MLLLLLVEVSAGKRPFIYFYAVKVPPQLQCCGLTYKSRFVGLTKIFFELLTFQNEVCFKEKQKQFGLQL